MEEINIINKLSQPRKLATQTLVEEFAKSGLSYIELRDKYKVGTPNYEAYDLVVREYKKIVEKAQSLIPKEEENIKHGMSYTLHDHNDPSNQKFVDVFFTQTYKP